MHFCNQSLTRWDVLYQYYVTKGNTNKLCFIWDSTFDLLCFRLPQSYTGFHGASQCSL